MTKFIELTKFFFYTSPKYLEPMRLRDYIYFPIAYIRFLYFSYR